jgi:hypothetical protein
MDRQERSDPASPAHARLLRRVGGLLAPVVKGSGDEPAEPPSPAEPPETGSDALLDRVQRLEQGIEDLQDALHRQSVRLDEIAAELHRRTDPEELARALSADARRRGL